MQIIYGFLNLTCIQLRLLLVLLLKKTFVPSLRSFQYIFVLPASFQLFNVSQLLFCNLLMKVKNAKKKIHPLGVRGSLLHEQNTG